MRYGLLYRICINQQKAEDEGTSTTPASVKIKMNRTIVKSNKGPNPKSNTPNKIGQTKNESVANGRSNTVEMCKVRPIRDPNIKANAASSSAPRKTSSRNGAGKDGAASALFTSAAW